MAKSKLKAPVEGLTKGLLLAVGTGAVIGAALIFPGIGYLYKEFKREQWEKAKKRGALRSTIKRLEKQELIFWKEENGKLKLTLTEKGERKVLQYKIDELKIKKLKHDGFWRIIVFDIPEKKRVAREIFRNKLKEMGLYRLQKSVFICSYECKDEVDFLRHALEIAPYVQYIIAKEISGVDFKSLKS